ncbi:MAG: reverse transcriptase domain-containing protein, partial [Limisphaerales bacterium]
YRFRSDGGGWILLAVYVDDFFWIGSDRGLLDDAIRKFSSYFTVTNLGTPEWFLGMRIRRGSGFASVDQSTYARKVLEQFGMSDCNPLSSPLDPSATLSTAMSPQDAAARAEMAGVPYREAIGSLMYLACGTRPDLAAAVGIAARFMSNPGHQHWLAVKRIFRYLRGTVDFGLVYEADPGEGRVRDTGMPVPRIFGYSDADWGADVDSRRSTSGYVFLNAGAAISWQSKRQPTVSLSSTESELMALVAAIREALSWRNRLEAVGMGSAEPIRILADNNGALALIKSPTSRETTKHIAIRTFFARDVVESGIVETIYVASAENAADVLTKAVAGERMRLAREMLGLRPIRE